jgi:HSP20 family protein
MTTSLPARTSRGLRSFFEGDPLRSLQEEMDSLLSRFSQDWGGDWLPRGYAPSLDLSESDEAVQVRMDVPGIAPKDIDIEIVGNTLRVKGERREEKEEKGKTFHRVERRSGEFARMVTLPCAVQEAKVQADYKDGVLTVTLPKSEQAKPHKIKVNGK